MKRYLLFAGSDYYPSGGWKDFVNSYDTVLEAVRAAATKDTPFFVQDIPNYKHTIAGVDWWHVIDSTTGEQVE